jgi:adenosylmethionine-8-amino-7-oxononanoate aminotransferase
MNLSERDQNVIWHPYTQMKGADFPISIIKGEGTYLFDENGKKYIDAVSSWWVNLHGHAHPYIAKKVSEQLNTLEHVIFAGFTHQPAVELAERLLTHLPSNQSKIFYSDNGSTAVEVALKMAIQYWHNRGEEKKKVIAFNNSYHGDTFGAMSVSARSAFTTPFKHFLFDAIYIDAPYNGSIDKSITQLKNAISSNEVAAFIFEPLVQGAGGMLMYEPSYLQQLIEVCNANNIITIADEVMTGFGRTGKFFAMDHLEAEVNIFCLSKGLTGGTMALGVTSCSDKIFDAFLSDDKTKTLFHGHSYTANPLACTAGLASLDLLEMDDCWNNIKRIEEQHQSFYQIIKHNKHVKNIRQCGTILAIEIETGDGNGYFSSIRDKAYNYFLDKGIILRPLGNVIYIMPPYCIGEEDLKYVYQSIEEFVKSIKS